MPLLLTLVQSALACGGLVPRAGHIAAPDAMQGLFELSASSVTVTYRTRYSGDADDFAWVIAVPGKVTEVVEGDEGLFESVVRASAPSILVDPGVYDEEGACGCGCSEYGIEKGDNARAGGDFDSGGGDTGVVITGSGFAGDYSYTTLSADDADSLLTWLVDNHYDTSLIAGAVEAYEADPLGYEWVAVQLKPDVPDTTGAGVKLDPLQITYSAASDGALYASFPARLGASAQVETMRMELYVLATGFATLSGWDAKENEGPNDESTYDIVGPDYQSGEGLYTSMLLELGNTKTKMWTAYAGKFIADGSDRWLTRYDAIVQPATNTIDASFTDSGEHTTAETTIYLQEESAYEAGEKAWLLPVAAFAVAGWRHRRRRG